MKETVSVELSKTRKRVAHLLQWIGITAVVIRISSGFLHYSCPPWVGYMGLVLYFIGMLGGMKLTFSRNR